MKAIEKARIAMLHASEANEHLPDREFSVATNKASITAFLDGILADPEAMERVKHNQPAFMDPLAVEWVIAALKQEAER